MAEYSLQLFDSVLNTTQAFIADLTPRPVIGYAGSAGYQAQGWRRTVRDMGGYWEGSFRLTGNESQLLQAWDQWLGYHLVERSGGMKTWEGMVYEMDLRHRGNHKRRTLDLLANAVKTTYTTLDYTGSDFITNGTFETGDFSGWTTNGATVDDAAGFGGAGYIHGGTYSAQVTANGMESDGTDDNYIRQNVNGTPGASYQLTVYARGDGDSFPRAGVRDPNESDWLVYPFGCGGISGYPANPVKVNVICPPDGEMLFFFYAGKDSGDVAYFDDIQVLERGEAIYETAWATDYPSISTYGRREWIEQSDNLPLATSEAFRDAILSFQKDPWPRPVGLGAGDEIALDIRVCGYVWTMNWLYVMEGDGTAGNVSTWLSTLVGTDYGLTINHATDNDTVTSTAGDCQFVKKGRIDSNTLQVNQKATMDERAWDLIAEITRLGIENPDSASTYIPAHAYVTNDRLFVYEAIETDPVLFLRGGQLFDKVGSVKAVSPFSVWPGVVRDMDYPVNRKQYNSIFSDARDAYVDEVEVDAEGNVSLRSTVFSDLDMWRARSELLEFTYEPLTQDKEWHIIPWRREDYP